MSWPSVTELAERCRGGDADAWDQLLERYERLVYSVASREGLTEDDAADVTQATFEAFWRHLGRIEDDRQIVYWLMTVARRQAWRVRDDRRRQNPDGTTVELERADTDDPIARLSTNQWLYEGLMQLDGACRELILALYFDADQPSYRALAARLGRPVGSIGPTRARCLSRLRDILEEERL